MLLLNLIFHSIVGTTYEDLWNIYFKVVSVANAFAFPLPIRGHIKYQKLYKLYVKNNYIIST